VHQLGQKRDEQRVGRAGQPREGELVADVGDHGRADADADAGGDRIRVAEGMSGREPSARGHGDRGEGRCVGRGPVDPAGLVRRRHIYTRHRAVTGVDDEVFDLDRLSEPDRRTLSGEAMLIASITAGRTGRMSDVVATIQSEQDEAIRADVHGVLVVAGGGMYLLPRADGTIVGVESGKCLDAIGHGTTNSSPLAPRMPLRVPTIIMSGSTAGEPLTAPSRFCFQVTWPSRAPML